MLVPYYSYPILGKNRETILNDARPRYLLQPTNLQTNLAYFFATFKPVSYTHLDVYKRQGFDDHLILIIVL